MAADKRQFLYLFPEDIEQTFQTENGLLKSEIKEIINNIIKCIFDSQTIA